MRRRALFPHSLRVLSSMSLRTLSPSSLLPLSSATFCASSPGASHALQLAEQCWQQRVQHRQPLGRAAQTPGGQQWLSPSPTQGPPRPHTGTPPSQCPQYSPAVQEQPALLLQRHRLPRPPEHSPQGQLRGEAPPALQGVVSGGSLAGILHTHTLLMPHLLRDALVRAQPQGEQLLQPAGTAGW